MRTENVLAQIRFDFWCQSYVNLKGKRNFGFVVFKHGSDTLLERIVTVKSYGLHSPDRAILVTDSKGLKLTPKNAFFHGAPCLASLFHCVIDWSQHSMYV